MFTVDSRGVPGKEDNFMDYFVTVDMKEYNLLKVFLFLWKVLNK